MYILDLNEHALPPAIAQKHKERGEDESRMRYHHNGLAPVALRYPLQHSPDTGKPLR